MRIITLWSNLKLLDTEKREVEVIEVEEKAMVRRGNLFGQNDHIRQYSKKENIQINHAKCFEAKR